MAMAALHNENPPQAHDNKNLESFSLLWLDAEVSASDENRQAQKHLRCIINHLKTFDDENVCEQYILSISAQDRIVFIVSGRLGRNVVPHLHHLRQIMSIYVYCMDKQTHEQWAKDFTKVKAVTIRLDDLISRIKEDQTSRIKVEEPLSFNIFSVQGNVDQSTTGLNGHFVHSLLLIDVLLRMKTIQTDKQQLISLCKNEYKDNATQLTIVHEFEQKYEPERALWWYSRESFLYKILNKALRTQNIDILFLFRFAIGDIYRQLKQNQYPSFVQVYRGQVMSTDEVENLRHSVGNFVSINSFFSTSVSRQKALAFLYQIEMSDNLHRVLFEIEADPEVVTSKPFADISNFSEYPDEQEVLFMIGCVFRLTGIRKSDDNEIWKVQMKLCGDNEDDMKKLFEHMKKEYGGGDNEADLRLFGDVVREMGKFDLAEKIYLRLLAEVPSNDASLCLLYYSLGVVKKDKCEHDSSLQWFHKSLEIRVRLNPSNHVAIGVIYNWVGVLYWRKGDYKQALKWQTKGVALFKEAHDENHLTMAHLYSNNAVVYKNQRKYTKALGFYQKSLTIYEKHLPSDHPDLGKFHNNIGIVHRYLGQYDLASEHYSRSLQIRLKSLPPNHPDIASSYENLGCIHEVKGELKQALVYFKKAAAIYHQSLSSQHPDVVRIEKQIQRVSSKLI